jgi:hypothetical protein
MDIVKESLLKAAGFTVLMLLLGVLVGLQMDELRQDHLSEELRQSNLETETFIALQTYIEDSSDNYCELMEKRIPDISERSAEFGGQLQQLAGQNIGDDSEYEYIRNRYYNNQLRLYSTLTEYRDRCGSSDDLILFFFDSSVDSQRQGEVLNELVETNNVSVFAFNNELNEDPEVADSPVVEILKADYNVTTSPTLIINNDQRIEGFTSVAELENEVLE